MLRNVAILVGLVILGAPGLASAVEIGDTVLAYWQQGNAYFVGTVVEQAGGGYLVIFEDGDTAVVPASKIRKNDIAVGSRVIARWSDGQYYDGRVARIVGRALYIHYDDGDKGWAPWSWIAVR